MKFATAPRLARAARRLPGVATEEANGGGDGGGALPNQIKRWEQKPGRKKPLERGGREGETLCGEKNWGSSYSTG